WSATASRRCGSASCSRRGSIMPAARGRPASWRGSAISATPVAGRRAAMASDFVVLSHREPYEAVETDESTIEMRRKTNGVFTTLDAVMRQKHGTWIAWREHEEGEAFETRVRVPAEGHPEAYTVRRIPLDADEARRFYYDFTS